MVNHCQYYINNKKRYCLKKSIKGKSYCTIHDQLKKKSESAKIEQLGGTKQLPDEFKSPYMLMSSKLPPNPPQQSWYHYQAPVYQTFGDYVCIKKSFLNTTKEILHDILGPVKIQ